MEYDVTIDRDKYIGGSDISVIMGLSPFKTRWQLLLEKAGLADSDSYGSKYTAYGHAMEPKIRDYINELYFTNYAPDRKYSGVLRCHVDGQNGTSILEIKTTSHVFDDLNEYKQYLVQLLTYMDVYGYDKGILAVYARPEDFSPEFDPERLQIYEIDISEYKLLLSEIKTELGRFLSDLERFKTNPLLSEEDFQPNELVTLSNKVIAFENQLAQYKEIERQYAEMKKQLYEAMIKYDVKSWETVSGVRITRVDGIKAKLRS